MANDVRDGMSFSEVGRKYGVSKVAVFKACERRGVLSTRSSRNVIHRTDKADPPWVPCLKPENGHKETPEA